MLMMLIRTFHDYCLCCNSEGEVYMSIVYRASSLIPDLGTYLNVS